MIRERYSTTFQPAAPVIPVLLGKPNGPPPGYAIEAQLDTGADRTVIPLAAVHALKLRMVGSTRAVGVSGTVVSLPLYFVTIHIAGVQEFMIDVAATSREPCVLLGRDVLNALHAYLDGPGHMLTLSAQPLTVTL